MTTHEPFRGIFPILQTPFREDDTIDVAALRREVEFVIEAGGHGMCWPQAGSEFSLLTDEERFEIAELLVRQARGRVPVIVGVQSTNYWKTALEFARHAETDRRGRHHFPAALPGRPQRRGRGRLFQDAGPDRVPAHLCPEHRRPLRRGDAGRRDDCPGARVSHRLVHQGRGGTQARAHGAALPGGSRASCGASFPAEGPETCSTRWSLDRTEAAPARTWSTSLPGSTTCTRPASMKRPRHCLTAWPHARPQAQRALDADHEGAAAPARRV